ncbi:SPASM domain-containing protein, partial [bacterium]|nr:SPASM domain-containing protein [bacterium]
RDMHGKDLFDRVVCNIKRLVSLRDAHKPGFRIEISYVVNAINIHQREKIQELASRLGVNWVLFRKMNIRSYNRKIAPQNGACQVPGEEKRTPSACLNGWFYLTLRLDGKTSYCYRFHQTHPGDINKVSLKKFWLSRQMMNMRLLGKYGYLQKKFKECQRCPFYDKNIQCLQDLKEGIL